MKNKSNPEPREAGCKCHCHGEYCPDCGNVCYLCKHGKQPNPSPKPPSAGSGQGEVSEERSDLRKEIKDTLDFMAEVYCQLGESGKPRTRPMKCGQAYPDAILKIIKRELAQANKALLENIYKNVTSKFGSKLSADIQDAVLDYLSDQTNLSVGKGVDEK